MSKGAINFSEDDSWGTPKAIIDLFGPFDYDPATTVKRAEYFGIPNFDTVETDGLKADWTKYRRIWVNPPFTMKKEFLLKAVETFNKTKAEIYFLLPISFLPTRAFHEIMAGVSCTIGIPNGRIKFESEGGQSKSPAFGSVVIKIGGENKWLPFIV